MEDQPAIWFVFHGNIFKKTASAVCADANPLDGIGVSSARADCVLESENDVSLVDIRVPSRDTWMYMNPHVTSLRLSYDKSLPRSPTLGEEGFRGVRAVARSMPAPLPLD